MGNNETIIAERIKKEMVLTDDEIAARKAENIEEFFKLSARDKQLKREFLAELRKTAYPRLKKVYGGVLYVKYLTSSPEFSIALKNLAIKARAEGEQNAIRLNGEEFKEGFEAGRLSAFKEVKQLAEVKL